MSSTHAQLFKPAKLLVPVDFSSSSDEALEVAGDFAEMFHSELHMLHVVPMFPVVPVVDRSAHGASAEEPLEDSHATAQKRLSVLEQQYVSRGIKATFSVEVGDDVVGNILRIAEREQSGLIVISTHGISGWRPLVFGSIADEVIKRATCPLLLLRTPRDA